MGDDELSDLIDLNWGELQATQEAAGLSDHQMKEVCKMAMLKKYAMLTKEANAKSQREVL